MKKSENEKTNSFKKIKKFSFSTEIYKTMEDMK